MALQALRRAAAKPQRYGALRYLAPQQQQQQPWRNEATGQAAAPAQFFPSNVNSAGSGRDPAFGSSFARMVSTAKEVGRDADSGLVSILRSELDHERKTYRQSKELARGPPKPWQMTERHGYEDIILRRAYGQEDIAVTCVYQPDQDYDGPQDDDDEALDSAGEDNVDQGNCVSMIITINKGSTDPTLEISSVSYGNEIVIENVFFWDSQDNRETLYQGPNYMQLDEELKEQFEKYVRTRGINKDLVGFLFSALADKEQREYMRWLQNVEAFVKQ